MAYATLRPHSCRTDATRAVRLIRRARDPGQRRSSAQNWGVGGAAARCVRRDRDSGGRARRGQHERDRERGAGGRGGGRRAGGRDEPGRAGRCGPPDRVDEADRRAGVGGGQAGHHGPLERLRHPGRARAGDARDRPGQGPGRRGEGVPDPQHRACSAWTPRPSTRSPRSRSARSAPARSCCCGRRSATLPAGNDGLVALAVTAGKVVRVTSTLSRMTDAPAPATLTADQAVARAMADAKIPAGKLGSRSVRAVAVPTAQGPRAAYEVNLVATRPGPPARRTSPTSTGSPARCWSARTRSTSTRTTRSGRSSRPPRRRRTPPPARTPG